MHADSDSTKEKGGNWRGAEILHIQIWVEIMDLMCVGRCINRENYPFHDVAFGVNESGNVQVMFDLIQVNVARQRCIDPNSVPV